MMQIIVLLLLSSIKIASFEHILTNRINSGLICNGKKYDSEKYPYVVSIKTKNKDDPTRSDYCTGTLINELYVLTAAHCVFGAKASEVTVFQGSYLNDKSQSVVEVHVHKDYDPEKDAFGDISVLKLRSGFPNLKTFIEIGGDPKDFADLKVLKCVCVGFGIQDKKQTGGWEGYMIDALVRHGRTACRDYGKDVIKYGWPQFLCSQVTTEDDLRMTCPGDSGGPMICNNKLYGVCSFMYTVGFGEVSCGVPEMQNVHIFVHYFLKWVNGIVYPKENDKKDDKKEDDKKEEGKKKKKKKKKKKSSGNSIKPYYKFHRIVTILLYCVLTFI